MTTSLRIATYNLENLDDKPGDDPTLAQRIAVLRPQLIRARADVLCLQEVNGQEQAGPPPRDLLALRALLTGTPYQGYEVVSTKTADGSRVYDERNLVIASRFPIEEHHQYKHEFTGKPVYKKNTAVPEEAAEEVTWERPILQARISLPDGTDLHVLNLHLKSKIPSNVNGQRLSTFKWRTVAGWAEGFFLSSLKRVGQALEARTLVDRIFDQNERAWIVVCGDFNADLDATPVEAIRGDVEDTGNSDLAPRVLFPCERTVPESSRFSLFHHGRGQMLDHILASRELLAHYRNTEIHNEQLHDESVAFAGDSKFPESDHAPVVADFQLP